MPELPEVETIKRGLQKKIIGLKIESAEVLAPKSFIGNSKKLEGKIVLNIWRRAKMLGIDLGSYARENRGATSLEVAPLTLLFHLKMSGQLIWVISNKRQVKSKNRGRFVGGHPTLDMLGQLPNKSTRVIFNFSDGSRLYFNDQRRFGWVRVIEGTDGLEVLEGLGPEPLEKQFTWEILKQNLLRYKNMPIKVALLDQSVVSGIGNIYASEACFNAGLDPRTKVSEMNDSQFSGLHLGVLKALRDGIKYGGSTKTHFVDAEGRKGFFLDYAFVYNKDKKPCKSCGTEIKKIKLAGRGTYFCPRCQKS